jgi:hypothetical protein
VSRAAAAAPGRDQIRAFHDGIKHKSGTSFGNVKADAAAAKHPNFKRMNFCSIIRSSSWPG